jgi:hypothetical protein
VWHSRTLTGMWGTVDRETGDLIVTVDAAGLNVLLDLLEGSESADVPLDPAIGRVMTSPIRELRIEKTPTDSVAITTARDSAGIAGSGAALAAIREFRDYNDLSEPGAHAHFDPADRPAGTLMFARDSRALIVAGPVPDEEPE